MSLVQAWQTVHPPVRGSWWRHRPRVHLGFWKSWTANGLSEKVCQRIMAILASPDIDKASLKLYITGAAAVREEFQCGSTIPSFCSCQCISQAQFSLI